MQYDAVQIHIHSIDRHTQKSALLIGDDCRNSPESFYTSELPPTLTGSNILSSSLDTLDWVNPQFSFCFRHEDLQPPKFNLNKSQRDLLKFSSRRIGSWESVVHRSRTNLAKRWCAGSSRYSFLETRPYKIIQDLIWQDVANMVFKFITTCRKAFRTHLIDQRPAWWHVQRTDTQ